MKKVVDSITDICYTESRKEETMTDAQRESKRNYDKKNTRMFCLKLNYNTDADLIAMLEAQDNVQGFIKAALYYKMRYMVGTHYYTDTDSVKEVKDGG